MRDTGLRREIIQTMQKDAHPAISTSGMKAQNVLAATFLSGSNARPNFVNKNRIKKGNFRS